MISRRFISRGDEGSATIGIDKLVIGKPIPFDVYLKSKGAEELLFKMGTLITSYAIDVLKSRGIKTVDVEAEDGITINQYLSKSREVGFLYDDENVFKAYTFQKEQHYQIDRTFLTSGRTINFSLFIINKFRFRSLVTASEKAPVTIDERLLAEEGDILIKQSDIPLYQAYLKKLTAENAPKQDKAKLESVIVRENLKILMRDMLNEPANRERITVAKTAVIKLIDCISKSKDVMFDFLKLRSHDYYSYAHSVNVAVLSVSLGITMEMRRDDLENLASGALLHDIGKSAVPQDILERMGKLNDIEFQVYKNHVLEGERILRGHKNLSEESLQAVVQHHEKLSGKGYPYGLSGEAVSRFGRIVAITNMYDTLTTPQLYKPALTPFYALLVLENNKADYDQALFKAFVKLLGKTL